MSGSLLLLTGSIYAYVGFEMLMHGKTAMGCVFFAYAVSNVGLFFVDKGY